MPEPPEHQEIEQLLRAYGRKRQEEAGLGGDMHPATRRLLLDEVRRVYGRASTPPEAASRSWLHWLILFWPRVGVAGALGLVLGGVIWISVRDHPRSIQLAQAEKHAQPPVAATPSERRAFAEPMPPPTPQAAATASKLPDRSPAAETSPAPIAQTPSATAQPAEVKGPVTGLVFESDSAFGLAPTQGHLTSAAVATESAPPAATRFRNLAGAGTAGLTTRLRRSETPARPQTAAVLETFSWTQTGPDIQIEDSDGSVYIGRVLPDPSGMAERPSRPNVQLPTRAPRRVTFQASGTNRTLNEVVVIKATLDLTTLTNEFSFGTAPAPAPPAARPAAASREGGAITSLSTQGKVRAPPVQRKLTLIEGTAKVGSNEPIVVRAVREQP